MKKFKIIFLLLTVLFAGCKDETFFTGIEQENPGSKGYLNLSMLEATLIDNTEDFNDENHNSVSSKSSVSPEFIISIVNKVTLDTVYQDTYTNTLAQGDSLALTPSMYVISVEPEGQGSGYGWDSPTYHGEQEFTIIKNITTSIEEIKCSLSNVMVNIWLSPDLKDMFLYEQDNASGTNIVTTVTLGTQSLDFSLEESRTAYFVAENNSNTLNIALTGLYNEAAENQTASYVETTWTASITNVKGGQWREIGIYLDHAYDGNLLFDMNIFDWTYNQEIEVKSSAMLSTSMSEEVIPEYVFGETMENSPTVSLLTEGDTILISSEYYDNDFDQWNITIGGTITPESDAQMQSVQILIESSNNDLLTALSGLGVEDNTINIYPDNTLSNYFLVKEESGAMSIKLYPATLTAIMKYTGTHKITVISTDTKDRTSYTDYTLISTGGPEVVWLDSEGEKVDSELTYNISTSDSLTVDIHITSQLGITAMIVEIDSDVLPESELEGLNLASKMDLINPASEAMATALASLGFPTGESVLNQTYLNIDITGFTPQLASLGKGSTTFVLKVSDRTGTTSININLLSE